MIRPLLADCRGSMALWAAIAMPSLLMAAGLGIEVGQIGLARAELQRTADFAAEAGAQSYGTTADAQTAAGVAADLAELNGASGAASRVWDASTQTLSDNQVTVVVGAGVLSAGNTSVTVTVRRSIAASFTLLMGSGAQHSVSATAAADVWGSTRNPQPCVLALDGQSDSVTTNTDVSLNGNASISLSGCSLRSDGGIALSGNASVSAPAIYAAGSIGTSGNAAITGTEVTNAGQIADPYATDSAMQTALAKLNTVSGTSLSDSSKATEALQPGTWSSWNLQGNGNITLAPGLYVVTGSITPSGNSAISGSGVTIIAGGGISMTGNNQLNLSAPGASATGGAVPGVVLASPSQNGSSITGNARSSITGLIYYPNGPLTFSGNADSSGTSPCLEVIANVVILSGNASLVGDSCSSMGALSFGSLSSAPVQLAL
jgi:Flp pilus assembly protein TadG